MARKKFDLAVKTGSYTDRDGKQKSRYQNIGVVMQGDDGGHYALLDPLINLAAVPREPGKDRVMVSMFTPKDDQQQAPAQRQQPSGGGRLDDDIPFAPLKF
jgi:single-stranded DNA-binding protein